MKNNQALTMYPLFFDPIYKKAEMKKIDGKDCICYQEDFWGTKVEEDGSVTFTMEAPKAETVEVSGFGGTLGTEKIALEKQANGLFSKNQSGVEIFYHEEIEYIESEKRKVRICSRRGSGEFYVRLNDLEHEFKGSLLVRVHASFIINLEKIRSVRKDTITMESGKEIPVTRKYKDQFNRAFQNYCLEMRR